MSALQLTGRLYPFYRVYVNLKSRHLHEKKGGFFMAQKKEGPDKGRYFAGIVAADSAPVDWREQLKASHAPYAISPLHTPDKENPFEHYHVVYKHSNTITLQTARKVIVPGIFKNDYLLLLHHPRLYQRYLIHLDDPDKQQFPQGRDAIEIINSFPLDLTRDFSQEERAQQRNDVFEFIRDYAITEYADLIDALMESGQADLLDYAANHTLLYNTYLTSRRNANRLY